MCVTFIESVETSTSSSSLSNTLSSSSSSENRLLSKSRRFNRDFVLPPSILLCKQLKHQTLVTTFHLSITFCKLDTAFWTTIHQLRIGQLMNYRPIYLSFLFSKNSFFPKFFAENISLEIIKGLKTYYVPYVACKKTAKPNCSNFSIVFSIVKCFYFLQINFVGFGKILKNSA